ncbi:hypothetical protein HBB16_08345 [Pseudonocardia sp. MCCB 268]|nr:hypothetical protein [Pseudonocardia cytotoxica]
MMSQLSQERLIIGITAVAPWNCRPAHHRLRHERTISAALITLQNTRFQPAEADVGAGRPDLPDDCIRRHMTEGLDTLTAAMCKWWLTDTQNKVVDQCLQLFALRYMEEYPIARLCRRTCATDLRRNERDPEGARRPLAVTTEGTRHVPDPLTPPEPADRPGRRRCRRPLRAPHLP